MFHALLTMLSCTGLDRRDCGAAGGRGHIAQRRRYQHTGLWNVCALRSLHPVPVNKIVVAVSNLQLVDPLIERVLGIDVVLVQGQYYANNAGTELFFSSSRNEFTLWTSDTGIPIGPYPVVKTMAWRQKVCIAGVGVWGTHLGKLDVVFDEHGVIQNCSGDAFPLGDDITPNASLQVCPHLSRMHTRALNFVTDYRRRWPRTTTALWLAWNVSSAQPSCL
jgi:hypothetical protein